MKVNSFFSGIGESRSAFTKGATLLMAAMAFVVFQGLGAQKAFAHSLTVTATAACSNGAPVISFTVTSWDTTGDAAGSNPTVQVLFNGVLVDTGAFTSVNLGVFSGSAPAPLATNSVDVEAVAVATWGDGFPGGETSDFIVSIPNNCAPGTGRFTGGGKQVLVDGVTVTKGFEVDCDLHQPSNNLEINWNGNQFHMTDFTSAACSLTGPPNPPTAPVNTIIGTGTGRYDGMDGFTVKFELIDNGEPGTSDESGFLVYETANPANVVLNVPLQLITSGNIQAHVDQK